MASAAAHKRLTKEYMNLQAQPEMGFKAKPNDANILEWHYIITGSPDTPHENGQYHGTLLFPSDYPYRPPGVTMVTPSGRFIPSQKICLSISDFHPESWNPAWSVSTILVGLQSFMNSKEVASGSMQGDDKTRKKYAIESSSYNVYTNPYYHRHFPEDYQYFKKILETGNYDKCKPIPPPPTTAQQKPPAKEEDEMDDFDFEDDGDENELLVDSDDEAGLEGVLSDDEDDNNLEHDGDGDKSDGDANDVVVIESSTRGAETSGTVVIE